MAGAGAKLFTSGSVLTADQVNTFLMDQSIMKFASTTARDAAFGGAGEPTLSEGMFAYTTDTNTIWLYDGAAWVSAINASSLNGIGEYAAYTPTFTNLTVGNGTVDFRFCRVNDFVHVEGGVTFGSTTSITGAVLITLPVTGAGDTFNFQGLARLRDSSTGASLQGFVFFNSPTEVSVRSALVSGTTVATANLSSTSPFTWATGDTLKVNFVYEAA